MRIIKKVFAALFFLSIFNSGFCQGGAGLTYNIGEMMGRPFDVNNYENIKGTPYFIDSFTKVHIMVNNGAVYAIEKMRLNLLTHKLHFRAPDNTELVASDGIVKKVVFYKPSGDSAIPVIFSNGYPSIDKYNGLNYYEELSSGETRVLKLTEKVIANMRNINASPLDKQFDEHTNIYLFSTSQNKIVRWRKGKDFLLDFLNDKSAKVEKYINTNHFDCRTIKDTILVIDYYNSL